MPSVVWKKALAACADSARARRFLNNLLATPVRSALENASPEQAQILAALWSGSETLGESLTKHPEWWESSLQPDLLQHARQLRGLRREVDSWLDEVLRQKDYAGGFSRLRRFRAREMMRIAARDLARLSALPETVLEISNVADVCLDAALRLCWQQWTDRLGSPWHLDADGVWQPTAFCVLGMGKLGGQELNYSSDVDLLFVYSEEGHAARTRPAAKTRPSGGTTNHQFFTRLAEGFIAEVTRLAEDGALYRIDMRLRPEGPTGPLVRSLGSYENYYAQWGQTWERMMLLKARCVAGDPVLASEFLETVQPFRYPRSLSHRILQEVAAMKDRIESEVVKAGELDRNVKLGRGGIREIEFVAQSLQLLHGGQQPFLQGSQSLPALQKLADYRHLERDETRRLSEAYVFLREVEHRLQMESGLQTHTLPLAGPSRNRLAKLMSLTSVSEFESALRRHTDAVRRVYDRLLRGKEKTDAPRLPADFEASLDQWRGLAAEHRFRDPDHAVKLIGHFLRGPGYIHVSPRTTELALNLIADFLKLCPRRDSAGAWTFPEPALSDPDRVLARLDSFISAYGSRALLYETWTSNPSLFRLLVLLFDRSEYLAETAIRVPDLVDDLELSGRLRRRKSVEDTLKDLRHGCEDADQRLWIRRYHQAELMRIGLRDILGLAEVEQNLTEISALAEACLQYACEVVCRKRRLKTAPLAIIGLGKMGGAELTFGSDLDIIFVAESRTRDLTKLSGLAREIIDLIASPTELGVAFIIDARLRPDGEKGLLVNSVKAHEDYYRQRAQLWEIQALSRARWIAGNPAVGRQFEGLVSRLTNFAQPDLPLAAYQPDWRRQIARMRGRIEKERTPAGKEALAFKTGAGGIVDAEFIAQTLCLAQGWREPNTLQALQRAQEQRALEPDDAAALIENYRILRRLETILRRWSVEGESVLPDDPAPLYRVAVRCGFPDAERFLKSVAGARENVRRVYARVFADIKNS